MYSVRNKVSAGGSPAPADLETVAASCLCHLPITTGRLGDEYHYQSLPLCIVDAVFSIGVRYESVRAVVDRYCDFAGARKYRSSSSGGFPPPEHQESVTRFCQRFEETGLERMTAEVFRNKQRTSTTGGILKTAAVLQFASVLRTHGVEYLQDVGTALASERVADELRDIPGQRSGISLRYFFMLAGSDELIKPDRMVLRFLERSLRRPVSVDEATPLLAGAVTLLRRTNPVLTPRLLDYLVWDFQRTAQHGRGANLPV